MVVPIEKSIKDVLNPKFYCCGRSTPFNTFGHLYLLESKNLRKSGVIPQRGYQTAILLANRSGGF